MNFRQDYKIHDQSTPDINISLVLLSGFILFLSAIAFSINHLIYQYPGNNFFPPNILLLVLMILLLNRGLSLFYGKNSKGSSYGIELLHFFIIMVVVTFATNAIQFTPFPIIDRYILNIEQQLKIDLPAMLNWTNQHPGFKVLLGIIYDSLPYQMSLLPLFLILKQRIGLLREYYFLLLVTVLVGFVFYYFFPTTAPASIIESPFFSPYQIATGLKFYQIHHHIIPTTNDGGLIALPSFHTIWGLLSVYLLKEWRIPCGLLLLVNFLLMASCVLLGWHYVLDVIAGIFVFLLSYCALFCFKKNMKANPIPHHDRLRSLEMT